MQDLFDAFPDLTRQPFRGWLVVGYGEEPQRFTDVRRIGARLLPAHQPVDVVERPVQRVADALGLQDPLLKIALTQLQILAVQIGEVRTQLI